MADETTAKEALQVAFTSAQDEHEDLERAAVVACQELALPEKLANATDFYCDTHNFVAISMFSAMAGNFGCVRVTFCNQNLSVAIKILLVAISRRYHNAYFLSLQQGGVFPTKKYALHVG